MASDKHINSVIVVGGGSSGTSIAYNLANRGKKVRLIERGNIASGNTGKSSALVRTHYSNELISSLALYSIREFMNFGNTGYSGIVFYVKRFIVLCIIYIILYECCIFNYA